MRKLSITIATLVVIAMLLSTVACAPTSIKPATVDLKYVANEWQGSETIIPNTLLTVNNPNGFAVMLDGLDYTVTVGNTQVVTKTLAPGLVIPANGSVNVASTAVIDYSGTLVVPLVLNKSLDSGTAAVTALPTWKLLGGKAPPLWATGVAGAIMKAPSADNITAALTDPSLVPDVVASLKAIRATFDGTSGIVAKTWAAAPEGPCVYMVKGKATISAGGLTKESAFDLKFERK